MERSQWILILFLFFISCKDDEPSEILNPSSKFASCNNIVSERCGSYSGNYCLFGFKYGEDNDFSNFGINAVGPQISGETVTFSFQEKDNFVDTHRQIDIPTESFSTLISCSKSKIRKAINDWSLETSIEFKESPDNSNSEIKFFVANLSIGGVGFPNFSESLCNQLSGHIILNPNYTSDCDIFYLYVLHEIGHALGLGHSSRDNIMGAELKKTSLNELQAGDIEGIRQIYGEK